MASVPSAANISEVENICGVTRDQAILLLRKYNSDPTKAVNAFYDDPSKALQQEQPGGVTAWNDQPYQDSDLPSYDIDATDTSNLTAPSRPPSRLSTSHSNLIDLSAEHAAAHPDQSMPYSQRQQMTDDRFSADDMAKATAMSLEDSGGQQNGVTSSGQNFGPATREYYPNQDWGLVHVSNATSHEVVVHPEPEDRAGMEGTPAFLHPSEHSEYLSSLLTILHSIPLAREALLMTAFSLPDYGHDLQWWSGTAIHVPRIVSLDHHHISHGEEEILHESQRLMAFLDNTTRAYGSTDQLGHIRVFEDSLEPTMISKFFDAWSRAAISTNPSNMLAMVFSSSALKMTLEDPEEPVQKDFYCLEALVDVQHGQTLYDVLDRTIWADQLDAEMDDVWIQDVAEVFTIRIFTHDKDSSKLDVKVPAVWYPDRYMDACKSISTKMRIDKMEIEREKNRLELLMGKYRTYQARNGYSLNVDEVLRAAATSAETVAKNRPPEGPNGTIEPLSTERPHVSTVEARRCAEELKVLAARLDEKIRVLEDRKRKAAEEMNKLSRQLTEQISPDEPPYKKYTLRGVSTLPHVTYVLHKNKQTDLIELENASSGHSDWQWWRISFSTEDGKLQAEQKPKLPEEQTDVVSWGYPKASVTEWSRKMKQPRKLDGDVTGYTIKKVSELEVLKAARDESKSALLVYANENAVNFVGSEVSGALKAFVETDNKFFEAELAHEDPSTVMVDSQDFSNTDSGWPESEQGLEAAEGSKFNNPTTTGKSYDGSIPTALLDLDVEVDDSPQAPQAPGTASEAGQEMQERGSGGGLLAANRQSRVPPAHFMDDVGEEKDGDVEMRDTTSSGYA